MRTGVLAWPQGERKRRTAAGLRIATLKLLTGIVATSGASTSVYWEGPVSDPGIVGEGSCGGGLEMGVPLTRYSGPECHPEISFAIDMLVHVF